MNKISFELNNGRKMELIQRKHDGQVMLVKLDSKGRPEGEEDSELLIDQGDFVMLMNYYCNQKREGLPIF